MATGRESLEELIFNPVLRPSSSEKIYKTICHKCPEDQDVKSRNKKKLIIASMICVFIMIVEIACGILANSLAMLSDAAHLLTDFGAFMVSLAAIWASSKPQTPEMSFGFHRAEVMGAFVSILFLWLLTGILVYMAIQRVIHLDYEIDAELMIYVSVAGTVANIIMGMVLINFKGRTSGRNNENGMSMNIKSAFLHVLGDLLQSIGVLIASLIIYFKPNLIIVDPICTFIFSFIVLCTTINVMRDIFRVLMEGFPKHLNFNEVKNVLFSIPGVVKIHNMRMWSLTMDKVALSAHIVVREGESQSDVLINAGRIIGEKLNIYEVTLQIEEMDTPVLACANCG